MGAKCRFVLVACHPKPGIASVGTDCFCILPQIKNNAIQACEANTRSGCLVLPCNWSGRICSSIFVQWQDDVLVKTSMLTADTLGASTRLPSVACWPGWPTRLGLSGHHWCRSPTIGCSLLPTRNSHHQIPMVCGMVFLAAASPGDRLPEASPKRGRQPKRPVPKNPPLGRRIFGVYLAPAKTGVSVGDD